MRAAGPIILGLALLLVTLGPGAAATVSVPPVQARVWEGLRLWPAQPVTTDRTGASHPRSRLVRTAFCWGNRRGRRLSFRPGPWHSQGPVDEARSRGHAGRGAHGPARRYRRQDRLALVAGRRHWHRGDRRPGLDVGRIRPRDPGRRAARGDRDHAAGDPRQPQPATLAGLAGAAGEQQPLAIRRAGAGWLRGYLAAACAGDSDGAGIWWTSAPTCCCRSSPPPGGTLACGRRLTTATASTGTQASGTGDFGGLSAACLQTRSLVLYTAYTGPAGVNQNVGNLVLTASDEVGALLASTEYIADGNTNLSPVLAPTERTLWLVYNAWTAPPGSLGAKNLGLFLGKIEPAL